MPLPALQQPSQAEDPNGVERHSSSQWKKDKVQSDCKEAKDMGYDLEEPVDLFQLSINVKQRAKRREFLLWASPSEPSFLLRKSQDGLGLEEKEASA
ncbi:unnamed protein product [Vicia faba]|uniref:Uncharacterized protein n=1 Tax=Vicia faba TaxID=3906 RepID=A0AAV0ZAM7_VICFA|nr:unnamed protein product [Vicia faba]